MTLLGGAYGPHVSCCSQKLPCKAHQIFKSFLMGMSPSNSCSLLKYCYKMHVYKFILQASIEDSKCRVHYLSRQALKVSSRLQSSPPAAPQYSSWKTLSSMPCRTTFCFLQSRQSVSRGWHLLLLSQCADA